MANNPYVNKVIYGNDTVMDISDTTATEGDVANGAVFYKANGARSVGTSTPSAPEWGDITGTLSDQTDLQSALDAKLPQSVNNVMGAKNLCNPTNVSLIQASSTIGTNSLVLNGSAKSYVAELNKNTKYIASREGGNRFAVALSATYPQNNGVINLLVVDPSLDEYSFDSGDYEYAIFVTNIGDASLDDIKPMLRLAEYTDPTYEPYAMTNKELTDIVKNVPQEIVRTGVTASANGTVRIPASGTDSRISTANTCVVTPIADIKSDGTPYKFKSCAVSDGYVTITLAEAISNVAIGVQVVNY